MRCWAGVSSSSKTTVSASTRPDSSASSSALPRPTKVAGSGRSRRWTTRPTTSAPAVSTSRASSSRPASTASAVEPGEHHADQHDALAERAVDEGAGQRRWSCGSHGQVTRHGTGATRSRPPCGPGRPDGVIAVAAAQVAPPRVPPGLCTRDPVTDQPPAAGGGGGRARCPVPQARVCPPRAPTPAGRAGGARCRARSPGRDAMNSTLMPPGCGGCERRPITATSTAAPGRRTRSTRWGLPMSTVRARRSPAPAVRVRRPASAGPMSTVAQARPGRLAGAELDGPHAGGRWPP